MVHVRLFTPDSSWTWIVTEYDPAEGICFGLACGHDIELGSFALDGLHGRRSPLGLRIKRGLWWRPTPLSRIPSEEVR